MTDRNDASAEGGAFKVTDRRSFDAAGRRRDEAVTEEAGAPEETGSPASAEGTEASSSGGEGSRREGVRYPVDFRTLLARFSIEALIHLGVEPNPESGRAEVDLDAARIPIDLLSLLEDRTRGNLSDEEARELQEILYQLRMLYVEKSSAGEP